MAADPSGVTLSLILPAYNEAKSIGRTLSDIRAHLAKQSWRSEIIVSADGTDGTRELVADLAKGGGALSVIGQAERRGKGYGVRQAAALAKGRIVGYMDADNKTPIEELDRAMPLLEQGYDVVIGSRKHADSRIEKQQKWYRKAGSKAFHAVVHGLMGLPEITDTQCGFKFFSRAAAAEVFSKQTVDGYMFDVELLLLAKRAGFKIAQVPVRWRDDGDSRLDLVSGNLRNLADLARIRLRHR